MQSRKQRKQKKLLGVGPETKMWKGLGLGVCCVLKSVSLQSASNLFPLRILLWSRKWELLSKQNYIKRNNGDFAMHRQNRQSRTTDWEAYCKVAALLSIGCCCCCFHGECQDLFPWEGMMKRAGIFCLQQRLSLSTYFYSCRRNELSSAEFFPLHCSAWTGCTQTLYFFSAFFPFLIILVIVESNLACSVEEFVFKKKWILCILVNCSDEKRAILLLLRNFATFSSDDAGSYREVDTDFLAVQCGRTINNGNRLEHGVFQLSLRKKKKIVSMCVVHNGTGW